MYDCMTKCLYFHISVLQNGKVGKNVNKWEALGIDPCVTHDPLFKNFQK